MKKTLVAYFSCTGNTKKMAQAIADALDCRLYEIKPAQPYTQADLDWTNKGSRSSIEMADKNSRPQIVKGLKNASEYQTIFLGFPIWWYTAPTICNSFLESYDFSNVCIIPFATSGGSNFGQTGQSLQASVPKAQIEAGKVLRSTTEATRWAKEMANK